MAASALDRAQIQYRAALAALDREQGDGTYERWLQIAQRLAPTGRHGDRAARTRQWRPRSPSRGSGPGSRRK